MSMRSTTKTMNQKAKIDHTFVICAYGECKYLEQCAESAVDQELQTNIIMITSTPNEHIQSVAGKYDIPLYINEGPKGITQDWNYALSIVKTRYATIAHQDDIYAPNYTKEMYEKMQTSKKPIIGFSDYTELHDEEEVDYSQLIKIKKRLLLPLRLPVLQRSRFVRRRILSLGCAICCPSVTYCLDNVEQPVFNNHFTCCEDWEAWEKLSRLKGTFIYVPKPLMKHRIHDGSVTTQTVMDQGRSAEDYEMYRKFWPTWIARILEKRYVKAEELNK